MTEATLIENLADPLLLIFGGQTERANKAARDLASTHGLRPELQALFGRDAGPLLVRAQREGEAVAFLPLRIARHPAPVYRVALARVAATGRLTALLTDMSREFAWREQLGARNRELSVLNDIGKELSSTLELDELALRIHQQAGRIMNTVNFYVALHDPATGTISFPLRIENHQRLPQIPPRRSGNGLTEHLLRSGQPLLLQGDVLTQAREMGLEPLGRPAFSWLGAPLLADGRAFGAIVVQDHDGTGSYDAHDLEVLMLIAGQAAAAVRNARLLGEARDAYRELAETQASRLEAERLRGITETVGALNHEVNNPLAAIAGNAQLLLRRPEALGTGGAEKVQRVLEAARRIQAVTNKMANLIHATSMPYPGEGAILDVSRSVARGEGDAPGPQADPEGATATPAAEAAARAPGPAARRPVDEVPPADA